MLTDFFQMPVSAITWPGQKHLSRHNLHIRNSSASIWSSKVPYTRGDPVRINLRTAEEQQYQNLIYHFSHRKSVFLDCGMKPRHQDNPSSALQSPCCLPSRGSLSLRHGFHRVLSSDGKAMLPSADQKNYSFHLNRHWMKRCSMLHEFQTSNIFYRGPVSLKGV